jgi:RNA polymerase-associated protein CTR9
MYIRKGDFTSAVNTFENVLRKQPRNIEAMAALASVHARNALSAAPGAGTASAAAAVTADANSDRSKARELFDQVVRLFQGTKDLKDGLGDRYYLDPVGPRIQQVARDPDLYVEVARLWTGDDNGKTLSAYRQSLQCRKDNHHQHLGDTGENGHGEAGENGVNGDKHSDLPRDLPPQLLCNIGSMEFERGELEAAQQRFEEAITLDVERQQQQGQGQQANGAGAGAAEGDAVLMTVMYNLGIAMEARGQKEEAIELYEKRLLARHPEFVEGASAFFYKHRFVAS